MGIRATVIGLLIQPLLGVGLIFVIRRFQATARLLPLLVGSGIAGAVVTSTLVFLRSTVPIAPYELSPNAWLPVVRESVVSLYVGFGMGVFISAIFAIPLALITQHRRKPPSTIPDR